MTVNVQVLVEPGEVPIFTCKSRSVPATETGTAADDSVVLSLTRPDEI
jgi:hypothetical protein